MVLNNTCATVHLYRYVPKVRLLVAEHTNNANLGHLGGFHSNAGERWVWAKLVAVIHKIVYLAKTTLLEDTM